MSIFAKTADGASSTSDRQRKEPSSAASRSTPEPNAEVSIVASAVRVEGDLHVDGDVRIGGRINGKVHVRDRLVLASGGIIHGGIKSGDGDIAGTVEGDVTVKGRLIIRGTASVLGQIEAENLVVEDGAAISGTCKVGKPTRLSKNREQAGDGATEGSPSLMLE